MIRFQDAVGAAIEALKSRFGSRLPKIVMVRDSVGLITVVLPPKSIQASEAQALAERLHRSLERYSPGLDAVLLFETDLIDAQDVMQSPDGIPLASAPEVTLVDRLLTNQEWLRKPTAPKPAVAVATAFSIKGGVGRSTALGLLAWHLARKGRKTIVVDLDLEAPGIGSMLLDSLPDYGVVDWLIESLVGEPDPSLISEMVEIATVSEGLNGTVHVVPAYGSKTQDYVVKLGRIYTPTASTNGDVVGLGLRLSKLVHALCATAEPPAAILLDARAGLQDIGASAVTQLGAEVFMFARDDQQTWDAYRRLFEHLSNSRGVAWGMPEEDLRWRLKMVGAQVDATESATGRYVGSSYTTWLNLYDDEANPVGSSLRPQLFARDDENAPHHPFITFFDPRLRGASFVSKETRPPWEIIEASFSQFLTGAEARLFEDEGRK
jgi:hypothetical protein